MAPKSRQDSLVFLFNFDVLETNSEFLVQFLILDELINSFKDIFLEFQQRRVHVAMHLLSGAI